VVDVGLDGADDLPVWRHADGRGQILISKDEDFVFLANRPHDTGRLIWVRLGNCRNAALCEAFTRLNDELVRAFDAGQRIVEVR
jgi:predicted nuclease of predicted toxin-antitoxin system